MLQGDGGLSDVVTEDNYGDYIDYPVDLGIGEEGIQDDWKIFYDNGTNVFIIAADYVPTKDNEETKIKTAATAAGMTNSTSANYKKYCWCWNSAPEKFSDGATREIETLFEQTKWQVYDHQSLSNSKCVSTLLNPNLWSGFKDKEDDTGYALYAVGGATVEMWCNSWNDTHESKIYTNKGASESTPGYYVGSSESSTTYGYTDAGVNETADKLWFPHYNNYRTFDESNECHGYWLASPSAYVGFLMDVDWAGNINWVSCNVNSVCLRPVVCLKSGASATYDANKKLYTLSK